MSSTNQMETEDGQISPYAFYAFYSLYRYFHPEVKSKYKKTVTLPLVCQRLFPKSPEVNTNDRKSLFITWKKKSKYGAGEYILRGCIGTFAHIPIAHALERYALVAALEDTRFTPITKKELPLLRCSCNILDNFDTIYDSTNKGDIYNWEIGKHGIELKFKDPSTGEHLSATFLPDVMVEQEWDKDDTFINLIEKAGVLGSVLDIMEDYEQYFLEVIRYEGHKSMINYDDFDEKLEELNE